MKYPIRIFVFACLLATIIGCKKSIIHDPLNPELKKRYSFKEGSYWIYKDSLTGREDSFFVSRFDSGYRRDEDNQDREHSIENVSMRLVHYNLNDKYSPESLILDISMEYSKLNFIIEKDSSGLMVFSRSSDGLIFPFAQTTTLSVNGKVYDNIGLAVIPSGPDLHAVGWYYPKDSIGLLKMDFTIATTQTHHIYELQRYNIVY